MYYCLMYFLTLVLDDFLHRAITHLDDVQAFHHLCELSA